MSRDIPKMEAETLSAFQRRLHLPEKEGEVVPSRFSHRYKKTSWSSTITRKVVSTPTSDGTIYSISNKFDFLLGVYMVATIPSLEVVGRYQGSIKVCWTSNIFHNMIKEAELCFDGSPAQYQDSHWLDIYAQELMNVDYSKKLMYNDAIGNRGYLQEWNTFIPSDTLSFYPPWYFCSHAVLAIPLFNCSLSVVTMKYKMRLKLSELVRMKGMNREGEWKNIAYNQKYMIGKGDGIEKPDMFARYSTISDSERKWRKTLVHRVLIDGIIKTSSEEHYGYGSTASMSLKSREIIKRVFWVAENVNASTYNCHSNYTTNSEDLTRGYNPVSDRKLSYGTVQRDPKMSSVHWDTADPFMTLSTVPTVAGYNSSSFAHNSDCINADNGLVTDKLEANMTIWIKNTDPFLNRDVSTVEKDEEDGVLYPEETSGNEGEVLGDPNARFRIHCYMLVTRELKFEHGKKVEISSQEKTVKM